MEFNVAQLIKENPGSSKSYKLSNNLISFKNHCVSQSPVLAPDNDISLSGTAKMLRTDAGIWVTAELSCEVICLCSRCLNAHDLRLSVLIDEEYYLSSYSTNDFDIDEGQFISNDNILDLVPSIRDHVDLELPLNPICREDCAGICIDCGLNLNQHHCSCKKSFGP